MKYLYCEKCQDLVSDKDVVELPRLDISVAGKEVKVKTLKEKTLHHRKSWTENFYNNAGTGRIGYCPVQRTQMCGIVREPTPEEYFIHFTCNAERNKSDVEARPDRKAPSPRRGTASNRRKMGARKRRA